MTTDTGRFDGKVAFVTGGGSGIGLFVPGDRKEVLAELEVFVRARVSSVFEGS